MFSLGAWHDIQKRVEEETVNFDYATVKNKEGTNVHTLIAGGRAERRDFCTTSSTQKSEDR